MCRLNHRTGIFTSCSIWSIGLFPTTTWKTLTRHFFSFFSHFVWHVLHRVLRQDKTKTCASERAHSDSTSCIGRRVVGVSECDHSPGAPQIYGTTPPQSDILTVADGKKKRKMCSLIPALGAIGELPGSWWPWMIEDDEKRDNELQTMIEPFQLLTWSTMLQRPIDT